MRNVILLMHVSLDGFVAGPNGEMDWIRFDDEQIDDVAALTATADTALFGRVTYQMMAGYWPTAAEQPNATKHDIDHARWVNAAPKIIISRTLQTVDWANSHIVRNNIPAAIANLKAQPGKNLLMIGSARTAHAFTQLGLIDEYRINVNPVVLGGGTPLFAGLTDKINLKLASAKTYASGVVGLDYRKN
ncbi:MAG: dihydrofolate reductase family protein [Chloroflexota bacterium]|nr:dihydrofolate reductase family protein [Chloroflexota bacterium]